MKIHRRALCLMAIAALAATLLLPSSLLACIRYSLAVPESEMEELK